MTVTNVKRQKAVWRDADPDGCEMLRVIFRTAGPRILVSEQAEELLRGEGGPRVRKWIDDAVKEVLDGIMKRRQNSLRR